MINSNYQMFLIQCQMFKIISNLPLKSRNPIHVYIKRMIVCLGGWVVEFVLVKEFVLVFLLLLNEVGTLEVLWMWGIDGLPMYGICKNRLVLQESSGPLSGCRKSCGDPHCYG